MDAKHLEALLNSQVGLEAYRDGVQPALREGGEALADLIGAARWLLAPLELAAAFRPRFQRFCKRISDKVPEERQVDPDPSIALQILNQLRFQEEDSPVAEMYLELMARAIDRDRQDEAHPGFVEVIKNLSPDEAVLLARIKAGEVAWHQTSGYETDRSNLPTLSPGITDWRLTAHHLLDLDLLREKKSGELPIGGAPPGCVRLIPTRWGRAFLAACAPEPAGATAPA